jgi:transcriptional regulator with XRE-family HTH domain
MTRAQREYFLEIRDALLMKQKTLEAFGNRLPQLRKTQGLTQEELAEKVGVTQRVIAYYEKDGAQPPGPILADLASALKVSVDELLGRKPVKESVDPKTTRLMKRLKRVQELPLTDQRTALKILDALLAKHDTEKYLKKKVATG